MKFKGRIYQLLDLFLLNHRRWLSGLGVCLYLLSFEGHFSACAQTRIKDVAMVQGARDNQLIGYGLVVGLDGKGDSSSQLTQQSLANLIRRFGVQVSAADIKSKNVAVVMVTAKIPPFARQGSVLDAYVASIADAKSLQGGTLLQMPLEGGNGKVYAVAQGSVSVGGFLAGTDGAGGASFQKNHPTAGVIPGGAIVEREIPTDVFASGVLEISLREGDFTSAVRMANAINQQVGRLAQAVSASTVQVFVPREAQSEERKIEFVARIENVLFRPDVPARIVINEKTGTIVANSKIRLGRVAVAHGNLTVSIASTQNVSQPNPFTGNVIGDNNQATIQNPTNSTATATVGSGAQTVVTQQTTTAVEEEKKKFIIIEELPTVEDVAFALNALGATPRDMMSIFQAMKEAGALQAELILQ